MSGIELVIFDWDGTLADSEQRIVANIQHAARHCGLPERPADQVRRTIGLALPEAFETLYPGAGAARLGDMVAAYRRCFLAEPRPPVRLFDVVTVVLRRLAGDGLLLSVATGKSRAGLDRELAESDLHSVFQHSRCADETRSKPHPQMIHEILAATGVAAEQAVMVGDTVFDMRMAQAAGCQAVAVSYGVHAKGELLAAGARVCLDTLSELPAWLATRGE